jgi:hypothetical protein
MALRIVKFGTRQSEIEINLQLVVPAPEMEQLLSQMHVLVHSSVDGGLDGVEVPSDPSARLGFYISAMTDLACDRSPDFNMSEKVVEAKITEVVERSAPQKVQGGPVKKGITPGQTIKLEPKIKDKEEEDEDEDEEESAPPPMNSKKDKHFDKKKDKHFDKKQKKSKITEDEDDE